MEKNIEMERITTNINKDQIQELQRVEIKIL